MKISKIICSFVLVGLISCNTESSEIKEVSESKKVTEVLAQKEIDSLIKEDHIPSETLDSGVIRGVLKNIQVSKYYDLYFESYRLTLMSEGEKSYYSFIPDVEDRYYELLKGQEVILKYDEEWDYSIKSVSDINADGIYDRKLQAGEMEMIGECFSDLSIESAQGGTTDTPNFFGYRDGNGLIMGYEDYLTVEDLKEVGQKKRVVYTKYKVRVIKDLKSVKDKAIWEQELKTQSKLVYNKINKDLKVNKFEMDTIYLDLNGGEMTAIRAFKNEELKYVYMGSFSDHGGEQIELYFDSQELKFQKNSQSYWVGNTDELSEVIVYYNNWKVLGASEKSYKGTHGYDAAAKELQKMTSSEMKELPEDKSSDYGLLLKELSRSTLKDVFQIF